MCFPRRPCSMGVTMCGSEFARISLIVVVSLWITSSMVSGCPLAPRCTCTMVGRKEPSPSPDSQVDPETVRRSPVRDVQSGDMASPKPKGRRVACRPGQGMPLSSLDQLQIDAIPADTIHLDLSGNKLVRIPKGVFQNLTRLEKLDLSDNRISVVEPGAFIGLTSLLKLDLSRNMLSSVNNNSMAGLARLQKLDLSANEIKGIKEGTFDGMPDLKKLELQSDFLVCDCHLAWVPRWMKRSRVRVGNSTACSVPKQYKGRPLRSMKKKELTCDWEIELSIFTITPATNQVVFAGDKLPFECRASVTDPSTQMFWIRKGHPVHTNRTEHTIIHTEYSPDGSVLITHLVLQELKKAHTGVWVCQVVTDRGNKSRAVNIVVLAEDTAYCPFNLTHTNKGNYRWPKTVSGVRAELPCVDSGLHRDRSATHVCSDSGHWHQLDVSRCTYTREMTRLLEQYSKETEQVNMTRMVTTADSLHKFLNTPTAIQDKMDVIYTARIIEHYGKMVPEHEELTDIILHIVSTLMEVDEQLLSLAQEEDTACSRLVKTVENLPKQLLARHPGDVYKYHNNIALRTVVAQRDTFRGITCAAYGKGQKFDNNAYLEDSFVCKVQENATAPDPTHEGMEMEASIHIPPSIFSNVQCWFPLCAAANDSGPFTLQFIAYKNSKLFPVLPSGGATTNPHRSIATSVISGKIVGVAMENTSSPIVLHLRPNEPGSRRTAVYWDLRANDRKGEWETSGCSVVQDSGLVTELHCSHLTYFGLMQSPPELPTAWQWWLLDSFTLNPAVYAGSAVLTACALAVTITFIAAHRKLEMPRKARHGAANLCLCVALLCVAYTLGVRTTRPAIACQVVGILLHYLSLCVLFWIIILTFVMYKKFVKVTSPPPPPSELLDGPPPPRPIITCYLIGWGVAIIICGISGAINWQDYAEQQNYCFLSFKPALLTFFGPAAFLVLVILIFFLRICCVVSGNFDKYKDPIDEPETEEIAVNDIEVLRDDLTSVNGGNSIIQESGATRGMANGGVVSAPASLGPSSSSMDLVYRPATQLRGVALLLLLCLLVWACAAIAIALPFGAYIPHQGAIFSYLYGILSAALGVFLLLFFCIGRSDGRRACRYCAFCDRDSVGYTSANDSPSQSSNMRQMPHANGHVHSGSSVSSNHTAKSSAYAQLGQGPPSHKSSNINYVPSLTANMTDPSVSSVDYPVFYNPRQNGVAKKYWQKNRQQRFLTQLSREMNGNDSGHSSHAESRGYRKGEHGNRVSYHSNSSDANSQYSGLLGEMQMRLGYPIGLPPMGRAAGVGEPSKMKSRFHQHQAQLHHPPMAVDPTGAPLPMSVLDRNKLSPVGANASSPAASVTLSSPPPHYLMPPLNGSCNFIPGQSNPNSVTNFTMMPPYVVPCYDVPSSTCNHTLPRSTPTKVSGFPQSHHPPVNEFMQRNGSVPRLRDFDGQSSVSQEPRPQSPLSDGPSLQMYRPPNPPVLLAPKRESVPSLTRKSIVSTGSGAGVSQDSGVGDHRSGATTNSQRSSDPVSTTLNSTAGQTTPPLNSPDDICDIDFLEQLENRIPYEIEPYKSYPLLPLRVGGGQDRKSPLSPGGKDTDFNPSPTQVPLLAPLPDLTLITTSALPPQPADYPPPQDMHQPPLVAAGSGSEPSTSQDGCSSLSTQPSTSSEQNGGNDSPPGSPGNNHLDDSIVSKTAPYSYFNHHYHEKVLHKLLRQQSTQEEMDDEEDELGIIPRSISAYNHTDDVHEADSLIDSSATSSTSSDDSDPNSDIWVMQKKRKQRRKLNKETSV